MSTSKDNTQKKKKMTDVNHYTSDELAQILQLHTITEESVVNATNLLIQRFTNQKNNEMVIFFTQVREKMLSDIISVTKPISNKVVNDDHNVMINPKQDVLHIPTVIEGKLNPTLKNTVSRIVNIDSKFRLSAVPNVKNKKFKSIVNYQTSVWSGTDFTLDFNDPLRNVLSFKLYSIQLPYSWYTIDDASGTNCFIINKLCDPNNHEINGCGGVTHEDVNNRVLVDAYYAVKKSIGTPNSKVSIFTRNVLNIYGKEMGYTIDDMPFLYIDVNGFACDPVGNIILKNTEYGNVMIQVSSSLQQQYYTLDEDENIISFLTITNQGVKMREGDPSVMTNKNTIRTNAFILLDSYGNTIDRGGRIKFTAEQTSFDQDSNILLNEKDNFKNTIPFKQINLENGNYTPVELIESVNDLLIQYNLGNASYNTKSGKSSITLQNKFHELSFYNQKNPITSFTSCKQGSRANKNLGWIMGFRDQSYNLYDANITKIVANANNVASETFTYYSEGLVDTYGTRYILLSIDDYNFNHINKALVSIENIEKKADVPSYFNQDLTVDPSCVVSENNPFYAIPTYLQGKPPQITQAQQYSLNEILKNRKQTSNNVVNSPTNTNIFAIIPIKKTGIPIGESIIEFSGPIQLNERNYFGPVDIDKMRVQLLDDQGFVMNLNGMDWSFSIMTEHLYQY